MYYPYILGLLDQLNEWNEKLAEFTNGRTDNAVFGTIVVVGVFIISAWGIKALNKK